MTMLGTFKKGKLEFETPAPYADGTQVEVRIVKMRKQPAKKTGATLKAKRKSKELSPAAKLLLKFAGTISDAPADWSKNHDHYAWGAEKR